MCCKAVAVWRTTGVELDDELLGDRDIDLRALGNVVHQDPQRRRNHLQPAWNRTIADELLGDLERVVASDFGRTSTMSYWLTR